MRKICIYTATRAEYGLLRNTILKCEKNKDIELFLIVSGSHLEKDSGYTFEEIQRDGIENIIEVPIYSSDKSKKGLLKSMAKSVSLLADILEDIKPEIGIVLGDRYEILTFAQSCMMYNIPLAHIHGGEVTEGVVDEAVRHAVTKMSHIHFPSTDEYKERILSMGEDPKNVFNFGAPGVENILCVEKKSKETLLEELGISPSQYYFAFTYHPVTLYPEKTKVELDSLLKALEDFISKYDVSIVMTMPNVENGSEFVMESIQNFNSKFENVYLFKSLGLKNYLSLLDFADAVVGNSSSGIIEAPSFKIPTVNIGERQKGRINTKSILNVDSNVVEIFNKLEMAISTDFVDEIKQMESPYGDGNTSSRIVDVLSSIDLEKILYKNFND